MWIRLLTEHGGQPVGAVIDVEATVGRDLMDAGLAEADQASTVKPVVASDAPVGEAVVIEESSAAVSVDAVEAESPVAAKAE